MRNGPTLLSAPKPHHLASRSLGAKAKDGGLEERNSNTSPPGAACVDVFVCVPALVNPSAAFSWSGQRVYLMLWPWLKWVREQLNALKSIRLENEKKKKTQRTTRAARKMKKVETEMNTACCGSWFSRGLKSSSKTWNQTVYTQLSKHKDRRLWK